MLVRQNGRWSRSRLLRTAAVLAIGIMMTEFSQVTIAGESTSDAARLSAKVSELESKLKYLTDRQQIDDVYLRYMRGFDRNDAALLRSAFWPDVQINYGSQTNTLEEFVVRHLESHAQKLEGWNHLLTNETVDVKGDLAHVEIYFTGFFKPKDKSLPWTMMSGRYIDRLDRRNGEWRISVREAIPQFGAELVPAFDVSAWYPSSGGCERGTLDNRDPSYRRPLVRRKNNERGAPCAK